MKVRVEMENKTFLRDAFVRVGRKGGYDRGDQAKMGLVDGTDPHQPSFQGDGEPDPNYRKVSEKQRRIIERMTKENILLTIDEEGNISATLRRM